MRIKIWSILILLVLLINLVSADLPIFVKPLESGNLQADRNIKYEFSFASDLACATSIFSVIKTIRTNQWGEGYTNMTIPVLPNLLDSNYFCQYRDNLLVSALPISDAIFNRLYAKNITTNNLRVEGIANFSGVIFINNGTEINGSTYNSSYSSFNNTKNIQELLNSTNIYCNDGFCNNLIYWANGSLFNQTDTINSVNTTYNIGVLYNTTASMIANLSISQSDGTLHNLSSSQIANLSINQFNWTYSLIANISAGQYQSITNTTITSINTTANINNLFPVNTTKNIQNLYNLTASIIANLSISQNGINASWSQATADTVYAGIQWNYNQTTAAYNLYNTIWSSTYNATYAASVANNTWNQTLGNQLYAPNTTIGIQWLINSTITQGLGYINTTANINNLFPINNTLNIQTLYNLTASMIANLSISQSGLTNYWGSNGSNIYNLTALVGIGTTSPDYPLQIESSGINVPGTTMYILTHFNNLTGDQAGIFTGYDSLDGGAIIGSATSVTGQPIKFWTYSGSAWGERMQISKTGNVGIGTTAPSQALDVRGQGNFSGTIYINNATDISTLGGSSKDLYETRGNLTTYNTTDYDTIVMNLPVSANTNYTWDCDFVHTLTSGTTKGNYKIAYPVNSLNGFVMVSLGITDVAYCMGGANCTMVTGTLGTGFFLAKFSGRFSNGANTGNISILMKSVTEPNGFTVLAGSHCWIGEENSLDALNT